MNIIAESRGLPKDTSSYRGFSSSTSNPATSFKETMSSLSDFRKVSLQSYDSRELNNNVKRSECTSCHPSDRSDGNIHEARISGDRGDYDDNTRVKETRDQDSGREGQTSSSCSHEAKEHDTGKCTDDECSAPDRENGEKTTAEQTEGGYIMAILNKLLSDLAGTNGDQDSGSPPALSELNGQLTGEDTGKTGENIDAIVQKLLEKVGGTVGESEAELPVSKDFDISKLQKGETRPEGNTENADFSDMLAKGSTTNESKPFEVSDVAELLRNADDDKRPSVLTDKNGTVEKISQANDAMSAALDQARVNAQKTGVTIETGLSDTFNQGAFKQYLASDRTGAQLNAESVESMEMNVINSSNSIHSGGRQAAVNPVASRVPVFQELLNNIVHVSKGNNKLGVTVEHESFGKLNIHLTLDKGMVNVHINTVDKGVREYVENNLQQIVDSLDRDGVSVGEFSIALRNQGRGEGRYVKLVHSDAESSVQETKAVHHGGRMLSIFA